MPRAAASKSKSKKKDAEDPPPNTTYKTFILAGERFTLGDTMLIKAHSNGIPDYIAKLEKIHTDPNGEVMLDSRWYYRPEETAMGRQSWQGVEEVIESDHTDTYHVRCVNGKCKIVSLNEYENLPPNRKKKSKNDNSSSDVPIYFSRSFYLKKSKCFKDPLPTYCFCKKPSNPDKLLLQCDKCEKWFHGECVRISREVALNLEEWMCPDCKQSTKKKARKS